MKCQVCKTSYNLLDLFYNPKIDKIVCNECLLKYKDKKSLFYIDNTTTEQEKIK